MHQFTIITWLRLTQLNHFINSAIDFWYQTTGGGRYATEESDVAICRRSSRSNSHEDSGSNKYFFHL
ncbi:hypothetical protein EUW78_25290 [Salmonella enterica subsp. enterica serovar Richmond]|nr:hypothetical protein [Salmonella enterica subsp. enterica serovar Richmond]